MPAQKLVYLFGAGRTDGAQGLKNLLGGKGANLAEMAGMGLPVPPGFTITTEVCSQFYADGRKLPASLMAEVELALAAVGKTVGATFGDSQNPLLVSVRSGARASMPGMMDTILNLGLNDVTVAALAKRTQDPRFAYDSYRRFITMYAGVVLDVDHGIFEDLLAAVKDEKGYALDTDMSATDWQGVVEAYKAAVTERTGKPFPQDTHAQLWGAITAVFGSWQNDRAIAYRRMYDIPEAWGTAVNVQAMVFGNRGQTSATGVAFTRNPATGANALNGEFLVNAQGEDVVAGIRTPQPLTEAARKALGETAPSLEALMPDTFLELTAIFARLEAHYRDMQDVEFTIQEGKLWMLQTRNGKRTLKAALKIAVDLVAEGKITADEAVQRIEPQALDQLLHPTINPKAPKTLLTRGLAASPGGAVGEIVLSSQEAKVAKAAGRTVILVRTETSPEDIEGMDAAAGILTTRGGTTSHAAVVARGMGRPCVCGASGLKIDAAKGTVTAAGKVLQAGDIITVDGSTGEVFIGAIGMIEPELSGDFAQVMAWADSARRLGVRANADTPRDAAQARKLGAEGIGLCRSEHMFFEPTRILAVREMILAPDEANRRRALAKLLDAQRADFTALFEIMAGLPVTIRLLDPPLHEFLPHKPAEITEVAQALNVTEARLKGLLDELHETNPMLGFRGCRLAIRYPEIAEMQARAILEAAIAAGKLTGKPAEPEIMIPLVGYRREFDLVASVIRATAAKVEAEHGTKVAYTIGTMIELPRAALKADEIASGAHGAEFFSFGTNDLTQTTLGLSRDDASPILDDYTRHQIFEQDPFASIDQSGVGELVEIGVVRGRRVKPDLKIGICGEHGGDPASIAFFDAVGLDYVSCSPFRVPVARLAAAQAALAKKSGGTSSGTA